MQMSKRALRMERHHRRKKHGGSLNLVSMMDIFTILVFFLLVSSGEVDVLPNAREIRLPDSVAEERARESVVVMVTHEQILVQGRPVISVADAMRPADIVIPALTTALRAQTDRVLVAQAAAEIAEREVTILGDRGLPYEVLKRVMASCTAADYGQVSLAVMQKTAEPPAAARVAAL